MELATSAENLELGMEQITIAAGSAMAGRTILEASLRQRHGVIVIGIQREDSRMEFNPEPDTAISPATTRVRTSESLKLLEPRPRKHG